MNTLHVTVVQNILLQDSSLKRYKDRLLLARRTVTFKICISTARNALSSTLHMTPNWGDQLTCPRAALLFKET